MRYILLCIFTLLFSGIFSQVNLEDLHSVWTDENKSDSVRLEALDNYIWEGFLYQAPDSAFNLSIVQYVMAKRSDNAEQTGNALANLGQSKLFKGDLDQAQKYALKNLYFTKSVRDTLGLPRAYNLLGMVYNDKMYYEDSKAYFDTCISIAQRQGQKELLTKAYHNIGVLNSKFSHFEDAIRNYRNSLVIQQSMGDIRGVGMTNKQIANVYFKMGNFSAAYEIYLNIIDVCEEAGNLPDLYAETCSDLGNLLHQQGDLERSAKYFKKSIAIASKHGYVITEAISLVNLGTNYSEEAKYEDALDYFGKALKIFRDVNHHYGEGVTLNNIGKDYTSMGDPDSALVYLNQGLEVFSEMENYFGMASSFNSLAKLHFSQKAYDKSIEYCRSSLALSELYQLHDQTGISYEIMYESYLAKGNLKKCKEVLNETKSYRDKDLEVNFFAMSENQKDLFFRTLQKDYGNYFDFALSHQEKYPQLVDTSFNVLLQIKGLNLKSATILRNDIFENANDEVKELYSKLIQLKDQIAVLYSRGENVEAIEKEVEELEGELINQSPVYSSFTELKKVSWRSLQKELKRGEVIIEFIDFKRKIDNKERTQYAAFILKHNGEPIMVPLCLGLDLEKALNVEGQNDQEIVEKLYKIENNQNALHDLVWKPISSHLERSKRLFVAPSGLLHKVSFASIPSVNDDIYLGQKFELFQNNSNSFILNRVEVEIDEDDRFLLIGGVQYSSDSTKQEVWNYLPATLEETNKITAKLSQSQLDVKHLSAYDANEMSFKSHVVDRDFVHVSTHGFFFSYPEGIFNQQEEIGGIASTKYALWSFVENKNPLMRSGITFAYANDVWSRSSQDLSEDGVLTAKEAANLDLSQNKLMVLSACETGLGNIHGSEAIYGLQRALKVGGVDNLIMSLWKVPDKEKSEFMELFYHQLLQSKSIQLAFNYARSTMSQKYDPYYWGAFVLVE